MGLQATELKALIKNFLSDVKKLTTTEELKARISDLDSAYVKITGDKDHVPGEGIAARIIAFRKAQNKLKRGIIMRVVSK